MKIVTNFEAQVLATSRSSSKDGNNTYFHATIFIPESGEAGTLNIPEKLYNELIAGQLYELVAEYNDKYNSFRLVGYRNAE